MRIYLSPLSSGTRWAFYNMSIRSWYYSRRRGGVSPSLTSTVQPPSYRILGLICEPKFSGVSMITLLSAQSSQVDRTESDYTFCSTLVICTRTTECVQQFLFLWVVHQQKGLHGSFRDDQLKPFNAAVGVDLLALIMLLRDVLLKAFHSFSGISGLVLSHQTDGAYLILDLGTNS